MTPHETRRAITTGRVVWGVTVLVAAGLIALVRVPTYLGVEAPTYDKRGNEYLWRVWWRARDDFVDVSPSWLLSLALLIALAVFVAAILAAYRIALSIPSSAPPRDD